MLRFIIRPFSPGAARQRPRVDALPMMGWQLLLVIVVAAIAGWFLVKTVLTFAVPERITGRKYLLKQLRDIGIPTATLHPAFFEDCIQWAQQVALVAGPNRLARTPPWRGDRNFSARGPCKV